MKSNAEKRMASKLVGRSAPGERRDEFEALRRMMRNGRGAGRAKKTTPGASEDPKLKRGWRNAWEHQTTLLRMEK